MRTFWDSIGEERQNVVIYGTGNGADRLLDRLEEEGIRPAGVFASDGFVRERTFRGYKVMSLREAVRSFGEDMLSLVGFGSDRPDAVSVMKELCREMRVAAPRTPLYDSAFMDSTFVPFMEKEFTGVSKILSDDVSLRTLEAIRDYRTTADLRFLFGCEENEDGTWRDLLGLTGTEDYVDIGAYRGDTIDRFISFAGSCSSVTAAEPDPKNFEKLREHTKDMENVRLFRVFASDSSGTAEFMSGSGRGSSRGKGTAVETRTVDSMLDGSPASLIKIDAEGSEEKVIEGCRETILRWRPKIKTAVYHRADDIWRIPAQILGIRDDYKVYLRHYPAFPDWNTEIIFV